MSPNQNEWTITDPDCLQCCRTAEELGTDVYELTQINKVFSRVQGQTFFMVAHGHIYLDDYSLDDEQRMLDLYSCDRADIPDEAYGQMMAEMCFETEILDFPCHRCTSWNQALEKIQDITGLDLSEHRKGKPSLSQKISSADKKSESTPRKHQNQAPER